MRIKARETSCDECPYREENKHCMDAVQKKKIDESGAIFPCHEELFKVVGSDNSGTEIYVESVDEFIVCRGRAKEIGMIK